MPINIDVRLCNEHLGVTAEILKKSSTKSVFRSRFIIYKCGYSVLADAFLAHIWAYIVLSPREDEKIYVRATSSI